MHRRRFIELGLATSGLALGSTASANDNRYRPGGPWAPNERAVNYSGYLDNEQLGERLRRLDERSDRIELEQIGESAGRGDPIWEVTVGDGDERVHVINQIHGDEPTGAEAMVEILQRLAGGSGPKIDRILDELTITIVPRANPDGANFVGEDGLGDDGEFRQRRYNTTEWEEGDSRYKNENSYAYNLDVPGYDLNRGFSIIPGFSPGDENEDWWSVEDEEANLGTLDVPVDEVGLELQDGNPYDEIWNAGLNLNPETQAVTESFLGADPDWALTHHHQGPTAIPESADESPGPQRQSIMSVMAPYGPTHANLEDVDYASYVREGNPFMSVDAQTRSLQLAGLVPERMDQFGRGRLDTITRYAYGPLWGSYLDSLCPQTDAAGALYEVSHQSDDRGHKALGTMVKVSVEGIMATFERIADGSVHDVDEMSYFDLPIPEGIENPHDERGSPSQKR
ncbi:M14 family zinc carboxypeptidase [Natronococcus jeotgali]|uniref:Peptidase M14 carboxypeptidase A n=1 Tax=Natronococcus jeotgali DSM 18795 TaxID=1227498 RepID=L9WWD9_9EURY|nr:M14 family zinc carboxypeptidase [Natronococcus jeotgali]ELY53732.1 peptidase M14 carboxypeptidase A [Natronococcus jeotgali DSM 18795]